MSFKKTGKEKATDDSSDEFSNMESEAGMSTDDSNDKSSDKKTVFGMYL